MRIHYLLIAIMLLAVFAPMTMFASVRAQDQVVTVAVDLSHGESDKYLDYIMGNITFVNWIKIDAGINSSVLSNVDVLILGQPTTGLAAEEVAAVMDWLNTGNKVLWVASDSDYGGGPSSQAAANDLLEAVGAKLRIETGAVYDDIFNAGAYYRVLGVMRPDNIPGMATDILAENITKPILFHGPSVIIWVDEDGNPHDPVTEIFPGLIRIAWTSGNAYIADNEAPALILYNPFVDRNREFVMLAAEYWQDSNVLIVASGESPYGDYEPGWSWSYHGVDLDGPQYVTNMIRWFTHIIQNGGTWSRPINVYKIGDELTVDNGVLKLEFNLTQGGMLYKITDMEVNFTLFKERGGADGFGGALFELLTDGVNPWYGVVPFFTASYKVDTTLPDGKVSVETYITFDNTTPFPGVKLAREVVVAPNKHYLTLTYTLANLGNDTVSITVAPAWMRDSGLMLELNADLKDMNNDYYYVVVNNTDYIYARATVPSDTGLFGEVSMLAIFDNSTDFSGGYVYGLYVVSGADTDCVQMEAGQLRLEFKGVTLAPNATKQYSVKLYAGAPIRSQLAEAGMSRIASLFPIIVTVTNTVTKTSTVTTTETLTQTQTLTQTKTITKTETQETTKTVEKTTTETKTVEKTATVVSTTTSIKEVPTTDWTMVGVVGIILLIIGLVIGFFVKKT